MRKLCRQTLVSDETSSSLLTILRRSGLARDEDNRSSGIDTFVLAMGAGTDLIMDFEADKDMIRLMGSLSFSQLSIAQEGANAIISADEEMLATVMKTSVDALTESAFMPVGV